MDVNGDVTPISQELVKKVESNNWNDMTVQQLYDQLYALTNRQQITAQMGRHDIAAQMQAGIMYLQGIIELKHNKERKNNEFQSGETIS